MDARLTFVTLAVADVAASRRFYVDGLGWRPAFEAPGEVMFFRVAPTVMLSLWSKQQFEAEVGPIQTGAGISPITLAHNMPGRAGVDEVLAAAAAAGARVDRAQDREWGGYSGYFSTRTDSVGRSPSTPGPSASTS